MFHDIDECAASAVLDFCLFSESWFEKRDLPPLEDSFFTVKLSDDCLAADCKQITKIHKRSRSWSHPSSLSSPCLSSREISRPKCMHDVPADEPIALHSTDFQPTMVLEDSVCDARHLSEQRLPQTTPIFPPQAYEPGPVNVPQDLTIPAELKNFAGQPQKEVAAVLQPHQILQSNVDFQMPCFAARADPESSFDHVLADASATPHVQHGHRSTCHRQTLLHMLEASGIPPEMARSTIGGDASHTLLHQILQSDVDFQMPQCAASADPASSFDHALADESATPHVQHAHRSTCHRQTLLQKLKASGMPPEMARSTIGGDASHTLMHQILQSDVDFQMPQCAASVDPASSFHHALADESATSHVQHGHRFTCHRQTLLHKLEASGMPPEMARSTIGGDASHTLLHQILQSDVDFQMPQCAASADPESSFDHLLANESATPHVQHGHRSTCHRQTLLHKLEASGMSPEMARSTIGGDASRTPLVSCHQYTCQADTTTYQSVKSLDITQPTKDMCQDSISEKCSDVPDGCTLMIRNLPAWVTTNHLVNAIKDIGLGASLQCLYLPQTFHKCWQQNNSYAFVNFATHDAAMQLESQWHLRDIFGKGTSAGHAKSKNGRKSLNISLANVQGLRENLIIWRLSKTSRIKNDNFRPKLFNQARGL